LNPVNGRSLKLSIGFLIVFKFIYAALTPFNGDFLNWIGFGVSQLGGSRFQGFYTGTAYVFAFMYYAWILLTGNTSVFRTLRSLFFRGPTIPLPLMTADQFLFAFWMKIPMLLADLATLFLIMHIVKRQTSSRKALFAGVLWAASPLVLLLEAVNTVEIYPALLILLGAYLFFETRTLRSSAALGIGTVLRLSPMLASWIYLLSDFRKGQPRKAIQFVGIQTIFLLGAVSYILLVFGEIPIALIEEHAPTGLLYNEVLSTLGPFLNAPAMEFSAGLGITIPLCVLASWYFTKPTVWSARIVAAEIVLFFSMFFAVSDVFSHFVMWMIPALVVFCVMTRNGTKVYVTFTLAALFQTMLTISLHSTSEGRAFLYIPNANENMAFLSSILMLYPTIPFLPVVSRSLLSAVLLFVVFYIIRET